MGRSPADTAERLVNAATIEFGRHGFAGARIDRIAVRAKANKQLVYYHFGSKQALYRVVIERAYLAFLHDGEDWQATLAGCDPEAAMCKLATIIFQPSASLQQLQYLIHDANMRSGRAFEVDDRVKRAFDRIIEVIASILRKGATKGLFRDNIDAREFYLFMLGALGTRLSNASTISTALAIDLTNPAAFRDSQYAALDFLIHGLRPTSVGSVEAGKTPVAETSRP